MDYIADVTFTGEAAGNSFGVSVSTAGDVNGDGFSDIIIGAQLYNSFTGRAYIYFGGAVMNNTVDLTIKGDSTTVSHFGRSVSSAGDVNNDGYSDVIVGAFVYGVNKGRAYIYYGGAVMNNVEDVVMTGEADNNYFGYCVTSAGDFNNDGYSDVIVSAIRNNSYTGKTYIFLGGASMDNIADVTMTGEAVSDYFGLAVSKAGDVNGDGISDVIVGAPYNSSFKGKAYIYYGGASVNNVSDVVLTGEAVNNFFGISLSGAGDVNNDGYDDVIIGAIGYSSYLGRAYIFNGGAVMSNVFDAAFTGTYPNYNYAGSVSSAGDVNNDGHSDLIVGSSHYYQSFFSYMGKVNLYPGDDIKIDLNLTLYIEGFIDYTISGMVIDTINVQLRNAASPYNISDSAKVVYSEYGYAPVSFFNAPNGTYYIVIKHRNSIETWSKSGGESFVRGNSLNYEFLSIPGQAYGNNLAVINPQGPYPYYAIFSGDVNQDGTIDASDLSQVENDALNSLSGYVQSDVTGDDFVDAADVSIVENNAVLGVSAITP